MRKITRDILFLILTGIVILTGCDGRSDAPAAVTETASPSRAATTPQKSRLLVEILFPAASNGLEMGQTTKVIVRVTGAEGRNAGDASLKATITTPDGILFEILTFQAGKDGVYRSESWTVPHHQQEGEWILRVEAVRGNASGEMTTIFRARYSTGEMILNKYGFWLDAPKLKGITSSIYVEQGDALNGRLQWGGVLPAQHVMPEAWVEIQWREGRFPLERAEDVRKFMLEELGAFGFTPIRALGPFEPFRFKRWEAWKVGGRGQYQQTQVEWVIFYAPEVNKTYSIGTTVVLPPGGVDPHEILRESFDIEPGVKAAGVAPAPLPRLLPGPELLAPEMGEQFNGLSNLVILEWMPVKELAKDEYYEVGVDFNWGESNPLLRFTTRDTRLTLPESLYYTPTCRVFNWDVTLMRKTGIDAEGQPIGEKVSYTSLYRYLLWIPFPGDVDFVPTCPNAQYWGRSFKKKR